MGLLWRPLLKRNSYISSCFCWWVLTKGLHDGVIHNFTLNGGDNAAIIILPNLKGTKLQETGLSLLLHFCLTWYLNLPVTWPTNAHSYLLLLNYGKRNAYPIIFQISISEYECLTLF